MLNCASIEYAQCERTSACIFCLVDKQMLALRRSREPSIGAHIGPQRASAIAIVLWAVSRKNMGMTREIGYASRQYWSALSIQT